MRSMILGVLVVGLVLVQVGPGHAQIASSGLPTSQQAGIFLTADALAQQLWATAAAARVRIGFESIEETTMPVRLRQMAVVNTPITDAINAVVSADDRYEWRAINGIVVVRPKDAWTDSTDPLNRPIRDVRVNNLLPVAVLEGLRDFLQTGRFGVNPPIMGPSVVDPVSFQVSSGTVLDVLDQLVTASDQTMWLAYSRRSAASEASHRSGLKLELRNAERLTAETVSPNVVKASR